MGVLSDGSYGIPKGIVFSFPVQCKDGIILILTSRKMVNSVRS